VTRWRQVPSEATARECNDSLFSMSVESEFHNFEEPDVLPSPFAACIPMPLPSAVRHPVTAAVHAKDVKRAQCGCSQIKPAPPGADIKAVPEFCYEEAESTGFQLRCKGYIRTKQKEPSKRAIYELAAADLYSTHVKHFHIARRLKLPEPHSNTAPSGMEKTGKTLDEMNIPPILVLHIMMPMYPGTLFPTTDGLNVSFIYHFRLPADFDPATFHTPEVRCSFCEPCVECVDRLQNGTVPPRPWFSAVGSIGDRLTHKP
jgi:hypothetical protein